MAHHDVVVVGAGPTGLLLAGDLAEAGVGVTVVDRLSAPSPEPKANAVVGQAARLLGHRGVLARLGHATAPAPAAVFQFGGVRLDLSAASGDARLHGVTVSQQQIERALGDRAAELGVRVRRSCELVGIAGGAADGPLTLTVRDEGGTRRESAGYVVGCDGGHSRVRGLAGIGFPGVTETTVVSRSAEVVLPGAVVAPERAEIDVPGVGALGAYRWNRTGRGAWSMLPRPSGTVLVSAMEWDDPDGAADGATDEDAPATVGEVAAALGRVLGAEVPMAVPEGPGPHQLRRWRGRNTRIADAYRRGRILLAGDAAHVHNAVGAPGLNVGLQDAACLAWRLAGTLRGVPGLLDGYQSDRRPAAERVAMHSQAQTVLLAPGDGVTALRTLLGELVEEPAVLARLARLLEGPDVRYPAPPGAHPLVGWFVPDTGDVDRLLGGPRPVLLDGGAAPSPPAGVAVVPDDALPAGALLVRPDGYVAWATDGAGPDTDADLRRAAVAITG